METGGLLMKTNFDNMTIKELKKYILENRNDQEAFHIFMERIDAQPVDKIYTADDLDNFSVIFKKEQKSSV
jgi:hypothetical protein